MPAHNKERCETIKRNLGCFPDVIAAFVVGYDYYFEGSLEHAISAGTSPSHLSSFPDGRIIAGLGAEAKIWDENGRVVFSCHLQTRVLSSEILNGKFLIVCRSSGQGGYSYLVVLFDSNTYARLARFYLSSPGFCVLQAEEAGVDVIRIVDSTYNGLAIFLYADTRSTRNKSRTVLLNHSTKSTKSIAMEAPAGLRKLDERTVVVVLENQEVKVFRFVGSGAEVNLLFSESSTEGTHANDASYFVTAAIPNGMVFAQMYVEQPETGCLVWFENMGIVKRIATGRIDCLFVIPGTHRVVVCCHMRDISIWNLHTGQKECALRKFQLHDTLVFLPNNDLAISHGGEEKKLLFIYDTTGDRVMTVEVGGHEVGPGGLSSLPSGKLACSSGGSIHIYR